jgi:phospholipase C
MTDPFDPSRRDFLKRVAAATGVLTLGACGGDSQDRLSTLSRLRPLPPPELSGIDHIVQVMMENRSFDHYLGWVPGADGLQAGLRFPNVEGELVETFRLSEDPDYGFQGCGWADPNHSYAGGRVHLAGGNMDGWLVTRETADDPADRLPVGYYTDEDLPFFAGAVRHFTVCDRYFGGLLASTFPNRMYIHAGATDRVKNNFPIVQQAPSTLPTIWDHLLAAGVSARNYYWDLPTTGLWGAKYAEITVPYAQFLADAALGTLPAVSYIDPFFGIGVGESPFGVARDDHPQADIRDGQAFLAQIYDALRRGPRWDRTLLIVTYDEWGGFFDHVVPPFGPISEAEAALGNDGRLGFRVANAIIGPRARRNHVSPIPFDPTSVINLIRWRWNLPGVGARADWSINMAHALDFESPPNFDAPDFGVPQSLLGFGLPCTDATQLGLDPHNRELADVLAAIRRFGFPI